METGRPLSPRESSTFSREDPSIYFRTKVGGAYNWYVIGPTTTLRKEELSPILGKAPNQYFSSCVAIGSTIYVIGGADTKHPSFSPPLLADVNYIDASRPEEGWMKAPPMEKPRALPHAVTINRKIYVMGSAYDDDRKQPWAEVFDPQQNCWRELRHVEDLRQVKDMKDHQQDLPGLITGHAILNQGKRILFHGFDSPALHFYDVEADSWDFNHSKVSHSLRNTSAFVDGILYFLDYTEPGVMFGIDVSKPKSQHMKVVGLDVEDESCNSSWIPQRTPNNVAPLGRLVSLGNGKLAVVWAAKHFGTTSPSEIKDSEEDEESDQVKLVACPKGNKLSVYCSKIEMSKEEDEKSGQVRLVAKPLSRSHHVVEGAALIDCLAVMIHQFPVPTSDAEHLTQGLQRHPSNVKALTPIPSLHSARCDRHHTLDLLESDLLPHSVGQPRRGSKAKPPTPSLPSQFVVQCPPDDRWPFGATEI